MTKKGRSKLIDYFSESNTHVLSVMMSTLCEHDSCATDPTTKHEAAKKVGII